MLLSGARQKMASTVTYIKLGKNKKMSPKSF